MTGQKVRPIPCCDRGKQPIGTPASPAGTAQLADAAKALALPDKQTRNGLALADNQCRRCLGCLRPGRPGISSCRP